METPAMPQTARASTAGRQSLESLLQKHEAEWQRFESSSQSELLYRDIPWPDAGPAPNALITFALQTAGDLKVELRRLQVRWHPDKWSQRYASRLDEVQAARVLDRVKEISQLVNSLKMS